MLSIKCISVIKPLFAITLYALTISAGEKLPDPSAKERSLGSLDFSNPKFLI